MNKAVIVLVSVGVTLVAAGCKKKQKMTCEKLYERVSSCFSAKERERPDKSKFVAECKQEIKHKAYRKQALECARKSDCAAFKMCLNKAEVAELREKIQRALKSGQWDVMAFLGCVTAEYKDPLKSICKQALPAAYKFYTAQVQAVRDRPMSKRTDQRSMVCGDLRTLARALGGEARAEVEKLCAQARLSWDVFDAIAAARSRLAELTKKTPPKKAAAKKRPPDVSGLGVLGELRKQLHKGAPSACYTVDDRLAKEVGAWATPHRKALYKQCFVAIGKVVLGRVVADNSCPEVARKLQRRITKRNRTAPGFKSLLKRAKTVCSGGSGYGLGGLGGLRPANGGPQVRMSKGSVTGGLDAATIRRIIRRHMLELKYCYSSIGLPTDPNLAGVVKMSFTITSSGAVGGVSVASSTLNHPATERCIGRAVRRWRFPKPEGSMPYVTFPFHFKPRP